MAIQYELVKEGRVLWQTYTDPVDMVEIAAHIEKLHQELYDKATKPIPLAISPPLPNGPRISSVAV